VPEERLAEAAARVRRTGSWASAAAAANAPDAGVGADAARRAVRTEGEVALAGPALVVELRPNANIASGRAGHSFGATLRERLPGSEEIVLDERSFEAGRVLAARRERSLVVVVRDPQRHAWMRDAAGELFAGNQDGIVVDIGFPSGRPPGAGGYVVTYGGSRAGFEAAVERMLAPNAVGVA
jgi:beta-N-acetylhexosaminidase